MDHVCEECGKPTLYIEKVRVTEWGRAARDFCDYQCLLSWIARSEYAVRQ